MAPGSFVRSRTAIDFTVFGRDFTNAGMSKGRKTRTLTMPTFSPLPTR